MRERGASSTPGAVAPAPPTRLPPAYPDSEEYEDEADWDVGVGDLVIDLDADLEKCRTPPVAATPPAAVAATMSQTGVEHQATDHKGLKMKIKRKNLGGKVDGKHESKADGKAGNNAAMEGAGALAPAGTGPEKQKHTEKDRTNKGRSVHKKAKDRTKASNEQLANGGSLVPGAIGSTNTGSTAAANNVSGVTSGVGPAGLTGSVSVELDRLVAHAGPGSGRGLGHSVDPFEFNPKLEDSRLLGFPHKKLKVDKTDAASSPIPAFMRDVAVDTADAAVITEPDCLGPCEPGTAVTLEGIVWQETENGMLVVNVTWRGKTYVGTLLDATRHDWAPPRFNCDSPTSDLESRTPKGRGKRRAAASNMSLNENALGDTRKLRKGRSGRNTSGAFTAPPSPAKSESSLAMKRKGRAAELENNSDINRGNKRCRTTSNSRSTAVSSGRESPVLIECPERNCNKKYRHINGLRYHQSHAHQGEEEGEDKDASSEDSGPQSPAAVATGEKQPKRTKKSREAEEEDSSRPSTPAAAIKCEEAVTPAKDKVRGDLKKESLEGKAAVPASSATVLQISGGTIISSSPLVTTQAATPLAASTLPTGSLVATTLASVPVTMATAVGTLVALQEVKVEKDVEKKKKGCDKTKTKTLSARPIVPAPAPGLSVPGALSPAMGSLGASTLKPIQPKPTILGEVATPNPALAGLAKEKKAKKKKVRDKEGHAAAAAAAAAQASTAIPAPTPVPAPQPVNMAMVKEEPRGDLCKMDLSKGMPTVIQPAASPLKLVAEVPERTRELGARLPPDLTKAGGLLGAKLELAASKLPEGVGHGPLSVNSPLQISTAATEPLEEAQSPAYSDISDESPGAPTLEMESVKVKEEKAVDTKSGEQPEHVVPPYGLYHHSYYGQPPYLMPAVSVGAPGQPPAPPTPTKQGDKVRVKVEPGMKPGEGGKPDGEGKLPAQPPLPVYQQYYGHYPASYMPLMEPHYQRAMEEQRRAAAEDKERPPSRERRPDSRPPSTGNVPQGTPPMHSPHAPPAHSPSMKVAADKSAKPPALISAKERKQREVDASLKEKQNENHQILKENLELKSQMAPRGVPSGEEHRKYEATIEVQRQIYYAHAHFSEERRRLEAKAAERQTPTKEGDKSREGSRERGREYTEARSREADPKRVEKTREAESPRGASPNPRGTPKSSKEGGHSAPGQPLPATYGQYYLQQPHYAQVPYPEGAPPHPLYRLPMGYPPGAYLHPSQVGYLPPDAMAGDKDKGLASPGAPTPEPGAKPLELVQQQYYTTGPHSAQQHKIHELQELAKTSEPGGSPAKRTESGSPAERSESSKVRTPPPQRHLHTHHHTHVVNPAYSPYDLYGAAIIASQQAAAQGPASLSHAFLQPK